MPALVFESVKFSNMVLDGKEMLYAGVLSSGVAFLLQIYGQQNLSPAPVAIIFSLEGVFASIFGWIILNQFLNGIKIIGIILILFAVIFSQLAPLYDKKKYGRV
jgi:drug/metabolite transporter (DMT)-like permease